MYIGKSISLKTRIKQHYNGYLESNTKAINFIPQTKYLYLKKVNNDLEAIILEANYIKTHQPRYNSILKDDHTNVYIVFTNKPNVRPVITHALKNSLDLNDFKSQLFGPYTTQKSAEILLKEIRKIFGYCTQPFNTHQKACFNYHLHQCPGACLSIISVSQYSRHLSQIKKFLSGKFVTLSKTLMVKIKRAIRKEDFETANKYKQTLSGLTQTMLSQNSSLLLKLSDSNLSQLGDVISTLKHPSLKTAPKRIECYDLAHLQGTNYVGAMSVSINGVNSPSQYRHFIIRTQKKSDTEAMKEIITRRLNHPEWQKPDLIILDGGIPQLSSVKNIIPQSLPFIALAKRQETIYFYTDNKITKLNLNVEDPVLNLFKNIRNEAHRTATTFHIKKRQKSMYS